MNKTGWPPPALMQDDDRKLAKWFSSRPDARRLVRESAQRIKDANMNDKPDALRLAVDLRLTVLEASVRKPDGEVVNVLPGEAPDRYAATRRAIVRAAAEIGKEMP